jgi:hypothetical protein
VIPEHGVDLLQAASDRLPAPDQFPQLVPEPSPNLPTLPAAPAISFMIKSHFACLISRGGSRLGALAVCPYQSFRFIDSLQTVNLGHAGISGKYRAINCLGGNRWQ